MHLSIHNRTLLRGMVAGAVALASASACSRSDRASNGRDTTQTGAVLPADTQANSSTQPSVSTQPTPGTQPSTDSGMGAPSAGTTTSGDTTQPTHHTGKVKSPGGRAAAPTNAAVPSSSEQGVAGYKAMGTDSSTASGNVSDSSQVSAASGPASDTTATSVAAATAPTDSALATADTSASPEITSDTSQAGAAPMARDTSVALAQGDTAVEVQVDTASVAHADTATIGDTGVILTRPDTATTEMAMGNEADTTAAPDTGAVANDSAAAERIHSDTVSEKAAELARHESARVRPPEDSTADASAVGAASVTSTGNIATGAEAVAAMTRQGERCSVASTDDHREVLWDLASSPATLNPCGTGTMTLPRIWTGEKK